MYRFSINRFIHVNNFSIETSNYSNPMFTHGAHFTSHTVTTNCQITVFIAHGDPVIAVATTAFSEKFIKHDQFPCVFCVVIYSAHPESIIDQTLFRVYTVLAAAKSVAGCGSPEFVRAHNRAFAVFLCVMHGRIQIMVGRAGQPKGWPGSLTTGTSTPVRLTTSKCGSFCGEVYNSSSEAAIMATIPAIAQPEITIINGQAVTSSLAVADYFTKRHDDVLKKIRTLECSPEFTARNFAVSEYTDATGRKLPCYHITRDGFAFLAMGFTGKRAAQFKEVYITAFNQMEKALTGAVNTSTTAHNAHVVYLYMAEIHRVWMAQLYPMLVASQSPIATSLYDYVNDAAFVAGLVDRSLNGGSKEVRK
uniref:Rha family phage regulatory protein n=1 Tax=Erwinia pyrifoliae TaxID=79967 RepID=UPI0037BECE7D